MRILNRIWPWSAILHAQQERENERYWRGCVEDFVSQCIAYIDHLEPGVRHIRLNNKLYCVGVDYCNEVVHVPNPRMNCIVTGITAPGSDQ